MEWGQEKDMPLTCIFLIKYDAIEGKQDGQRKEEKGEIYRHKNLLELTEDDSSM